MSTQTPDVFMVSAGRGISLNLLQNTSMSGIVGHSYPWTSFVYAKLYLKKTKGMEKGILETKYVLTIESTLTRRYVSLQQLLKNSEGKETCHVITCVSGA